MNRFFNLTHKEKKPGEMALVINNKDNQPYCCTIRTVTRFWDINGELKVRYSSFTVHDYAHADDADWEIISTGAF